MKNKIQRKWDNMNKTGKLLSVMMMSLILLAGMGSAYYTFFYDSGDLEYSITGTPGDLSVDLALTDISWDLTNSLEHSQNLILNNANGETEMQIAFDIIVNGTDPSCAESGDIEYHLYNADAELFDNDLISLPSGITTLSLNATAIGGERSCPRSDILHLSLTE